jgi:dolichol-phosphate mannosyltransferase
MYYLLLGSLLIGLNGVVGFSRYPLLLISVAGVLFSGVAFLFGLAYIVLKLAGVAFPVGNPTIVFVVTFLGGIQLLSLGVMGEYVGRIYDEARDRPRYILESQFGFEEDSPSSRVPQHTHVAQSTRPGKRS